MVNMSEDDHIKQTTISFNDWKKADETKEYKYVI